MEYPGLFGTIHSSQSTPNVNPLVPPPPDQSPRVMATPNVSLAVSSLTQQWTSTPLSNVTTPSGPSLSIQSNPLSTCGGGETESVDLTTDIKQQENIINNDNGDGFHSKLVLRLKKTKLLDNDGESESFEKQEISKNDSYCWVCHEGGEVLCCDKCPRVFHLQCSGLTIAPEDEDEWICPVCKNIARKPRRSRPYNLKELLQLAVTRMMFPGTEIFQRDIPGDIIGHYREYVFHPMHLGMIKEKVLNGLYHSTRQFLHQTEWILHNCIIYNGGKHALTKIAKGIVKICKEDMREVELCPSCYGLTVKQPADWFCFPCNPPHKVVLAKVRGYPLWPAKLISVTTDKCDVRFFGQHDRSLVPRSCIQILSGPPPTPTTKTAHWVLAMEELTKYRQNIDLMLQHIDAGKTPEEFIAEKMAEPPSKDIVNKISRIPKKDKSDKLTTPSLQTMSVSPTPSASHNGYSNERAESDSRESSVAPSFTVSNHIPCSPQIVMVNPPLSESDEVGTIHGNSASFAKSIDTLGNYSEPSSPGSDNGLTIDLGAHEEQKGKRVAPSGNKSMLKGSNKKVNKLGPEVYFNSKYGSAMDVQMITPSSNYHHRSSTVQSRPGEALSLITHNLAEKRALELRDSSGSSTPGANQDAGEEMETAFSSIYPPGKRAIAVVDPNAKRQPKRKKGIGEVSPLKTPRHARSLRSKKNDTSSLPTYSYEGSSSFITGYDTSNGVIVGSSQTIMETADDIPHPPRPLPLPPSIHYGEGLLANTMRTIDQSYNARLDGIVGSTGDMGYQYFSEKLMSSIKTVVIEMLSIFESKGKSGAKQIKDHLHTAWPVPDSRSQLEKLKAELKDEMAKSLEVIQASADMEREQIVAKVKAQAETEKQLAIQETKKKKWCTYCLKEAQYNCCWNANYCNEACQQSHWPNHMSECTQVQQTPTGLLPRTPAPHMDVQKMMSPHQNADSAVFTFNDTSSQPLIDDMNSPDVTMGGASFNLPSLKSQCEFSSAPPIDLVATVTTVPAAETMISMEVEAMVSIEQVINHSAMLVHPSSPQMQSVMMSQPMMSQPMMSQPMMSQPHLSMRLSTPTSPTHAMRLIQPMSPTNSMRLPTSVSHAHLNPLHGIPIHAQPLSPPTLHQSMDNTSLHVNNTFSWPYQQPIVGMSHDMSHALPLMPQVPAQTPTTQPNSFFRVF